MSRRSPVDPEIQVLTFDRRHDDPKVQRIPGFAEANGNGKRVLARAPRLVRGRRSQIGGH